MKDKYLLSKIQKETYEKGLELKAELEKITKEAFKEHYLDKEKAMKKRNLSEEDYSKEERTLQGMLTWMIYENRLFDDDVYENLINDEGYEPFKKLAYDYILFEKNKVIESAKRNYECKVSWIETGKFLEEIKKEVIKIDTPLSTAAFIIGTAISGGDPQVGKALAKFVKKRHKR